ncbi:protein rolling stone-like [Sycon ciliatum]|uniref:protein rolling stone-like n=1 Tax=Sycon ciliatum TaxID=27933 RepID=UPI0020A84AE5|eukprot:scpid74182/ scgid34563/ Protein rolling stone
MASAYLVSNPDFPVKAEFAWSKFRPSQENALWLASSPFIPDLLMLMVHSIFAVYSVVIIFMSAFDGVESPKWFIYLSNLGYLSVMLSFVGFAVIGVHRYWRKYSLVHQNYPYEELSQALGAWRWFHSIQQIMFTIALSVSTLITLLYYTLLAPDGSFLDVSIHALNTAFCFVELCLSNFKLNILQVIYPLIAGVVYIVFTIIYALSGGTDINGNDAIYPPLDWNNKPGNAALLSLLAAFIGVPLVHLIYFGMMKIRIAIARRVSTTLPSGIGIDYEQVDVGTSNV